MPAVEADLARTLLPDGYRQLIKVNLKFFLGQGQKKCWRIATTHIGQKVSKLGHDSPGYFCRSRENRILRPKTHGHFLSLVEILRLKQASAPRHLPASGASAHGRVLIYLN